MVFDSVVQYATNHTVFYLCTENKIHIMNETIILKKFAEIDLNDSFIKTLKRLS